MAADHNGRQGEVAGLAQAIQEVTERTQLLIREEIELARAEVETKVKSLIKGIVVAFAAGFFVMGALVVLLHGFSWLAWYELSNSDNYFWGFFLVAGVLLLLAVLAALLALRAFKRGAPPTPQLAIDEAKLIKETVQSPDPPSTVSQAG